MKNIGILSLLIMLIFTSCRKEYNEVEIHVSIPDPIIENYEPKYNSIKGDVDGYVIDENNEPVAQATVLMGDYETITDDFGHFFLRDETMNSLGTLIIVEKENHFQGSRRFYPKEGKRNNIKIQLLDKNFNKVFNAALGGVIEYIDGPIIEFSPNSIITESGIIYEGMVEVAFEWIQSKDELTLNQIPGGNLGLNSLLDEQSISSYGIVAVELQSQNGELLNIAPDNTAKLSFPIPENLINLAPSEVLLGSFNDDFGLWVNEEKAFKEDVYYVADVSHFSFWNCYEESELVNFEFVLHDENNDPIKNCRLTFLEPNGGFPLTGYFYSNENGEVSGIIPADKLLKIKILDYCELIYDQLIGPFSSDISEEIIVANSNQNNTTIKGILVDCENNVLENGVVKVDFNNNTLFEYTNDVGEFEVYLNHCESIDEIEITGINPKESESGETITVAANEETDLGDFSACEITFDSGLTVTIDGESKNYTDVIVQDFTTIQVGDLGESIALYFIFEGGTPGDYSAENIYLGPIDDSMGWEFEDLNYKMSEFIVTEFDDHLVGYASGILDVVELPIEINFNIEL